ncbi:MAG: helix-turn-helix domain-containing protein [bacterium]|nr:helix-turn-helix domain-containing protein [bacterium]
MAKLITVSVSDAARELNVTERTIYRYLREKKLKKRGGKTEIIRSSLEALKRQQT